CILFSFFLFLFAVSGPPRSLHSFPTRRSSDLRPAAFCTLPSMDSRRAAITTPGAKPGCSLAASFARSSAWARALGSASASSRARSEEHTSELQSRENLVCRLLLEKKKQTTREQVIAPNDAELRLIQQNVETPNRQYSKNKGNYVV